MQKLLKVTLLLIASLLFTSQTFAADLNIDCRPSECTKSGLDPVFSTENDGVWHPGRIVTRTINLKNSANNARQMAIRGTRAGEVGTLEQVMNVSITPVSGGSVIWAGSLAQFYVQDRIWMGTFEPDTDRDYNFTVGMNYGADNDYQNLQTTMDLTLGFWSGPPPVTPTPPPTANSNSNGNGDNGNGGGNGGGNSPAVCNDAKPGTPSLLSAAATGPNQVTLNWSKAEGSVTYYLLAFGQEPGVMLYGNPNVGGVDTTSYTINNLSGGTTYYFKVRAGNGCMPGELSNQLSATPRGQAVTSSIPAGFLPGVLGVTEEEPAPSLEPSFEPESSSSGILGVEATPEPEEGLIVGGLMGKLGWFVWGPLALFVFLFRRKFFGKKFPF